MYPFHVTQTLKYSGASRVHDTGPLTAPVNYQQGHGLTSSIGASNYSAGLSPF